MAGLTQTGGIEMANRQLVTAPSITGTQNMRVIYSSSRGPDIDTVAGIALVAAVDMTLGLVIHMTGRTTSQDLSMIHSISRHPLGTVVAGLAQIGRLYVDL